MSDGKWHSPEEIEKKTKLWESQWLEKGVPSIGLTRNSIDLLVGITSTAVAALGISLRARMRRLPEKQVRQWDPTLN